MSICYLDCSPFTLELLKQQELPADAPLRINVGDPAPESIPEIIRDAQVILNGHTPFGAELMAASPTLRSIIFLGTGASSYIDLEAAEQRGLTVRTIKGYGDRSIAEHSFALALAGARQIARMDRDLRSGHWEPLAGIELAGRTMGIIGAGGIGSELARIALAFGMKVLIWNRRPLAGELGRFQVPFEDLLAQSDILSLHLALTEETRGLIGARQFARMKPGVILVNTARGALVDEAALAEALVQGQVAHAALDVYTMEPLPGDSPLVGLPNVTLSAHAAFKTAEASQRLVRRGLELAVNDLRSLRDGAMLSG